MGSASFIYNATVQRVVDGDNVVVSLDRGFADYSVRSVRLEGCNADEQGTPAGDYAKEWLTALLPSGVKLVVESVRWDEYGGGRIDGAVFLPDGTNLSSLLISLGLAAPYTGRGPRPVPVWPPTGGIPPLPPPEGA